MLEVSMYVLGMIQDFMRGYFFYQVLCGFMKQRENRILRVLGWILFTAILSIPYFAEDPVNISVGVLLFLAAILIAFQAKWIVRVSAILMFYPIIVALNFLWYDVTCRIFFRYFGGYGDANTIFYTGASLLTVLFWYLFWKLLGRVMHGITEFLDVKSWVLLDAICLTPLAAVFGDILFTPQESYKVYPSMAACLVTSIGSIYLASYLADRIRVNLEGRNLRLQQSYYEELERNQTQIRKLRHDMNNHLAVVGGLLEEGNTEEALDYFKKLSGYMETGKRRFCQNSIVNALLNVKYNAAVEVGIDLFFHISIDGMMGIDDVSLCTVFANTLDNAIEACAKIPDVKERKMSVRARYTQAGYFSYEITNSKVNEIREKKGRILTDKEDGKAHGFGLTSVREIVERYGGTVDFSYTEKEFSSIILISV